MIVHIDYLNNINSIFNIISLYIPIPKLTNPSMTLPEYKVIHFKKAIFSIKNSSNQNFFCIFNIIKISLLNLFE